MATVECPVQPCRDYLLNQWPGVCAQDFCKPAKVDPQHVPFEPFLEVTHSTLKVHDRAESPQPNGGPLEVTVYNGSNNKSSSFSMKSTDTIGKLRKRYVRINPEMIGSVDLALNGKCLDSKKTLGELGVMRGARFITFQRCIGG